MAFAVGMFEDANRYGSNDTAFRYDVQQWKSDGFTVVVCSNGDQSNVALFLAVCDDEGFSYIGNAATEINRFLYDSDHGDFTPGSSLIADTQANADAIVQPIVAALGGHPSLKAWYLVDEPHPTATSYESRLIKLRTAFNTYDGTRPVTAMLVGLTDAPSMFTTLALDTLMMDVYPIGVQAAAMDFTMKPFGYDSETFTSYTRTVIADAGIDQSVTPLWMALQAHDVQFLNEPEFYSMRRPTVLELKAQFFMAIGEGADLVAWFVWGSRTADGAGNNGWTGLQDLPTEYGAVAALSNRVAPFADLLDEAYRATAQDYSVDVGYCAALKTPSASGARTLLVVCNTTAATDDITISGTAGTLRNLETQALISVGATISLPSGEGRIYEWTAAGNAQPTGHSGVPILTIPDYTVSAETFWGGHPFNPESSAYNPTINIPAGATEIDVDVDHAGDLWAAIQAAQTAEGVNGNAVVWVGSNTYDAGTVYPSGFSGQAMNGLQIRAKAGTTPVFTGILRVIPIDAARDYITWSGMLSSNSNTTIDDPNSPGNKIKARDFTANYKLNRWYIKGITFTASGAAESSQNTQNMSFSTCRDIVVDNCTFTNITHLAPPDTTHPGHVTGNSALNNIWLRNCTFSGRSPGASGTQPWLAIYLDGLHGGGVLFSNFTGSFQKEGVLFLCNDDFSRDYNLDGSIPVAEQRHAQFNVIYGNTFSMPGGPDNIASITGRRNLFARNTVTSTTLTDYSVVHIDSKSNNITNTPIAKFVYSYDGNVVRHNFVENMGGSIYLARATAQTASPQTPPAQDPQTGQTTVTDNVVNDAGFSRWLLLEGGGPTLTPNVIARNADSGTVTPPVIGGGGTPGVAAPAQLVFTTQPSAGAAHSTEALGNQPVLEVRDIAGDVLTDYTGDITVSLASGQVNLSLGGTLTVAAVAGVATFTDLTVSRAATNVILRATSVEDVSGLSTAFDVTDAPAVGNITLSASPVWYENASGLGNTIDVTSLGITTGDFVVMLTRKEDNTKIFAPQSSSGHLSNTNPWGSPSQPWTVLPSSRVEQSNTTLHVSTVLYRVATGSETSYTLNWASGSGGRMSALVFKVSGSDPTTWIETITTVASGASSTTPTITTQNTTVENEYVLMISTKGATTDDWTPDTNWATYGSATDRNLYAQVREFTTAGSATGEMSPVSNAASYWTATAIRFLPAAGATPPPNGDSSGRGRGRVTLALSGRLRF